jgi:transposase
MLRHAYTDLRSTQKPVLVLDQHSSHWKMLSELEDDFDVEFMPPQSCEFNPIETIWGLSK